MDDLGNKIMLRHKQMQEEREYYEDRDELVARFVNPRRELVKDSQRFDDKGERRGKKAYSAVPMSALAVWADGMQGHMVSQSLRWFKSQVGDMNLNKNDEVQAWLQTYDEAMYGEFNRSNFYAILGEWFRDAGSLGTATLYTEEDIGQDSACHTPIHLREILIAEDRYGKVDTVHRKFFLTARQALQKFDEEKLSEHIKKNAKDCPEKKHEFIHAVFPNTERMYGSLLSEDKPWASVYIETGGENKVNGVVKKGGYDVNPYSVWRLRKNSDEIYGYSPAHDAMTTILGVNQITKTMIKAAHMAVSPPLNVPEHMRGNTRITPDGLNYFERNGDTISYFGNHPNYPIGIDREERMQRIIEDVYRVDFFLILARAEREMTATEIMERQSEKAVLLGPQVDRLVNEGLSSVFDIVSDIADKAGRLPPPPQVLLDAYYGGQISDIDIRFTGPLAQAQRMMFDLKPVRNGLNELAQASVVFPNVLKRVREKDLGEFILDATGFPQTLIRSDEEYEQLLQAEQEMMQQRQMMEMAQGAADAVPKLSKEIEPNSPMEALVNG